MCHPEVAGDSAGSRVAPLTLRGSVPRGKACLGILPLPEELTSAVRENRGA